MGGSNSTEWGDKPLSLSLPSSHADVTVADGRVAGSGDQEILVQGENLPEGAVAFELTVERQSQVRNWVVGVATEAAIKGWKGPGDGMWYTEETWLCWDGGAIFNGKKERRQDSAWWGHTGKRVTVRVDPKESGRVDFWVDDVWQGGLGGADGLQLRPVVLITDGEAMMRSLKEPPELPKQVESTSMTQMEWISRSPDVWTRRVTGGLTIEGSSEREILVHSNAPLPLGVHAWDITVLSVSENRNWTVGCATQAELDRWEGAGDGLWYKSEAWIFWDGGAIMNGDEQNRVDREQWGGKGQTLTIRVDTAADRVDFWIDGRWQARMPGVRGKQLYPVVILSDGAVSVGQTSRAQNALEWIPPAVDALLS